MTNSQRLAIVRSHLVRWLRQDFSPEADTSPGSVQLLGESILIQDGYYGGRTFRARVGETLVSATWFMEPDELKIRSTDGTVVASFQGPEIIEVAEPEAEVAEPVFAGPDVDSPQLADLDTSEEEAKAAEEVSPAADQESPCRDLICLPISTPVHFQVPGSEDENQRKAA
ncbi:MAG: hypothetical protein AAFV88_04110 [Planctomycetota bacterium]